MNDDHQHNEATIHRADIDNHPAKNRIAEVVKNYQDAFYPEYVPEKVAAALLVEFDITPRDEGK